MIDARIYRQLQDGSEWSAPDYVHPHDGLRQALRTAGADRAAFVEALRQRLGSSDLRQRTGAIALLPDYIADIGAERALAALHSMPLEAGEKPAWRIQYADLQQAAAIAIAHHLTAADVHALRWVKDLVVSNVYRLFLLQHIARIDPDWVLANTALVEHRNLAVLTALPVDRRGELIAALAPWPAERPTVLTRAFWKKVPPAEAARLRSMMWPS